MLLTVFNSLAFLGTRRLIQVFPEPVQKLWNNWELRVLVLVSLTLQLCLLHFGSRRRYSVKTWLRVFLWLCYLGADSVATVALGVISTNQGNCNDSQLQNELIAFWAPFLLLHLGGQDTITAYAVQDNELWLRHLLGLVVQSGVALYIFLSSWKVSWLSFLTIPMFLAGFIKYAERTWVLKSANYDIWAKWHHFAIVLDGPDTGAETRRDSFRLFVIFRCLFLNQKANFSKRHGDISNYHISPWNAIEIYSEFPDFETTWKTIEDELGYAYDVYYTKAPLFFTAWGFVIRFFSFTCVLFVFVLFLIRERHKHPQIDLIITYLLLVGAILTEINAVILLSASDWPWLYYDNKWLRKLIETLFDPIINRCAKLTSKQRWSNSMGQLDLLSLCLKDKSLQVGHGTPKLFANLREWAFNKMLPKLNGELEMLLYRTHKQVSRDLKDMVFNTFRKKLSSNSNGFSEEYDKYITNETVNLETYQSIMIWHIATDLCFYTDSGTKEDDLILKVISKDVSDYMMYILAMCPLVLSTGNAKLSFEQNCTFIKTSFQMEGLPKAQACAMLLFSAYEATVLNKEDLNRFLSDDHLLPMAGQLAKNLSQEDRKWEILSKFWVENLAYVATLCQGNNHAQLLRKGGEFLTHIWLLKEHFNLSSTRGFW